ncbi:MAG: M20/M25/M40 family metallo-hydrolase [Planctomycetota bacterium]|jgi:hypothetical protein
MHKLPLPVAGLLAVALFPCLPGDLVAQATADAGDKPYRVAKDAATGAATIKPEQLKVWLTRLTSREFAGRGTGQKGFGRAAAYVRDHFKRLGLEPGGDDGGYLQIVPWKGIFPDLRKTFLEVKKGNDVIARVTGATGLNGQVARERESSGQAAYVELTTWRRPDLEDFDLEDKVVFLRVAAKPRRGNLFNPTKVLEAGSYASLARRITRAGAAEVICVTDTVGGQAGALVGSSWMDRRRGNRAIRGMQRRVTEVLFIDQATMNTILTAAAPKQDDRNEILNDDDEVVARMSDLPRITGKLTVEMETDEPTDAPACNVVGILRGSDPKLKDEFVAVGCHLDHLGVRVGVIHPGADDDGSGSAALMAIAQAFASNQVRPRRSAVFMAFCGEEKGLIGSSHFANGCRKQGKPIKLSQIVGELQVDMIGRNETLAREMGPREEAEDNLNTLHLIGSEKISSDLHDVCMRANARAGFELEWDAESVFYRSDHWNFAKYGVPVAFFFTGFHRQYHQPEDTVEKIDFPKLARVAAYVYDIGFELAQADMRPMVDPEKWRRLRSRRRLPKDPAAPMRPKKKAKDGG